MCRGPVGETYRWCYPCHQHRTVSGGALADVVLPIAYGVKGEQHYQNLVAYKASNPAVGAKTRLRDLTLLFLREHWKCLVRSRGELTDLAIVPSTRGRPGPHPLASLVASRIPLRLVAVAANAAYPPEDRDFHTDRFQITTDLGASNGPRRVLLLDDTWTTGGRIQSMAYALKAAGALAVVSVVLGRLLKHEYPPSRRLLARIANTAFDITRCALPDCRHGR